MVQGAITLVDPRLRYTFKAQMTSPCAGMNPITIAANSPQSSASWNAPKGGNYTITVHVTVVNLLTLSKKLPDVIGDATLNYIVTGGPALPPNLPYVGINTTMAPPSGSASAPANVTIYASVSSPGYPAVYTFTTSCDTLGGGAPPCQGGSTTTVSTLPATLPPL